MKRKLLTSILLTLICLPAVMAANKEKATFNLLAQYRQDIPADVIKKVKKEMGYFDSSYPRIHDGWIEHPFGKSIDLQGNELFPEIDYNGCMQVSPTHFQLRKTNYSAGTAIGVVRTDGQVIVPMENQELKYYPLYNVILANVDWAPYGYNIPKKGTVKIYNYFGDLLYTIDGVSGISDWDLQHGKASSAKLTLTTDSGRKELSFTRQRSDYEQDQLTKFYSEGPQATTYNIIRELCASNKKGDQKKAMDIIDYYMENILPDDGFARTRSTAGWDATLRYLACLNFTKDYGRFSYESSKTHSPWLNFIYVPNTPNPPMLKTANTDLPQVNELVSQTEPLFMLAVNEYQQKLVRDEQRAQAWMAVLGVLANSLSSTGGYTAATPSKSTSTTSVQIPQMSNSGKTMLEQTSISPEITGAAMCAGWVPDTPSSSSSTSTSSSSSSSHSSSSNRVCHACFGKGTHQVCNGTGMQLAFGNKRTEKCSYCHGSGKCPSCNGTGHH